MKTLSTLFFSPKLPFILPLSLLPEVLAPPQGPFPGPFVLGAWSIPSDPFEPMFAGAAINASDEKFWVNKDTNTYCPANSGVPCADFNGTQTVIGLGDAKNMNAGADLDVFVPGGQALYIAPDNTLSFTAAHSAAMPQGSKTLGFYNETTGNSDYLFFKGQEWYLCPFTRGTEPMKRTYQVYSSAEPLTGCTRMEIKTYAPIKGIMIWQYT
ncbi:hypothetical protein F5Y16DRAFT_416543 [Xylariaceae sp. FL0255]|nr:hypothetical protein F5Y16DRAFT_416543 [Xylariaceae sp. FL0255]